MPHKKHTVKQGDCISSIAYHHSMFPDTIWNDTKNSDLKKKRKSPNELLPGDVVYVRKKEEKEESCSPEQRHRFRRKGVPETLEIQFLDEDDNLRTNIPYVLTIDGMVRRGKTDDEGTIREPIPPNARNGELILGHGEDEEVIAFALGHMDPITEITGIQGRLNNLGYQCGRVDGVLGEETSEALSLFQADHDLKVTGKPDEETLNRIEEEHRS